MSQRRLTPLDIEQIQYLAVRGVSRKVIAKFIGCSTNTIDNHVDLYEIGRYRDRLLERCREEREREAQS